MKRTRAIKSPSRHWRVKGLIKWLLKLWVKNWRSLVEPVSLLLLSHLELLLKHLLISSLSLLFSALILSSLNLSLFPLSLHFFSFVYLVLLIVELLLVLLTGQIKMHFFLALYAIHLLAILTNCVSVSRLYWDLIRLASLLIWTVKILLCVQGYFDTKVKELPQKVRSVELSNRVLDNKLWNRFFALWAFNIHYPIIDFCLNMSSQTGIIMEWMSARKGNYMVVTSKTDFAL